MKTVLAIVCSLILALATLVAGPVPAPRAAGAARACCHHCGGHAGCCAAKQSLPGPQPTTAAPVSSSPQFSPLSPDAVVWTIPNFPAHPSSTSFIPSPTTEDALLFKRDCAWLI